MWFSNGSPAVPVGDESRLETYNKAILDAKEAASSVSNGGTQVEVYAGLSFGDKTTVLDLSGRGLTGSLKAEVRLLSALVEPVMKP